MIRSATGPASSGPCSCARSGSRAPGTRRRRGRGACRSSHGRSPAGPGHPAALERDRVEVAGHRQVVAQDDRVAALLGGPAADPVDPRAIAGPEHPVDEPVVRGQVVLGQEVDLERGLGDAGQAGLIGRPRLLVEVAPEPVRDVVVGEPLLGDPGVAVVEAAASGSSSWRSARSSWVWLSRGWGQARRRRSASSVPIRRRAEGVHSGRDITDRSGPEGIANRGTPS